jgi:hypothetical protein
MKNNVINMKADWKKYRQEICDDIEEICIEKSINTRDIMVCMNSECQQCPETNANYEIKRPCIFPRAESDKFRRQTEKLVECPYLQYTLMILKPYPDIIELQDTLNSEW